MYPALAARQLTIADWPQLVDIARTVKAPAVELAYKPTGPGRNVELDLPERFRDRFEREFPHDELAISAMSSPHPAGISRKPELPLDNPLGREIVRAKLFVALARRLRAPFANFDADWWRDAGDADGGEGRPGMGDFVALDKGGSKKAAFAANLGPVLGVLNEVGKIAGLHRVRIPVPAAVVNAHSGDEVRRFFLAKSASAVGWLFEPATFSEANEDPVAALERAGDFVYYARLRAEDVIEEKYDVAAVIRALGCWYDGAISIVSDTDDGADYSEAVECIHRLVPDLAELASPSDYTKMSFPSSTGRLLNGEGSATVQPDGPATAGAFGTWQVTYTVGPNGIRTGGCVNIRAGHASTWPMGQVTAPAAPNYVTASLAGEAASRAKILAACTRMAAATVGVQVKVVEGELREGDEISVIFGDTSGGSPGFACQTFDEKEFKLRVEVDNEGDGLLREVPDPPCFAVVGGAPDHIKLIAPAVVRPGEEFSVLIRAEDRYLNVSTEGFDDRLALEGDGFEGLPAAFSWPDASSAIGRIEALSCPSEGIFYIRAQDGKSGAVGLGTPVKCAATGPKLFWGDIHSHSYLMDGTGTPDDNFLYARDVAGLDIYSMADHVDIDTSMCQVSHPAQWGEFVTCTKKYYEPGRFVTILGFEIAQDEGDYNVYYRTDGAPWFIPATNPWELFRWLRVNHLEAIVIPHMSSYPVETRGYDLNYYDPEFMKLAEIYSCHGGSDVFGAPRPLGTCEPGGYIFEGLAKGYRLGLMGSGDGHHGRPGNTQDRYNNGLIAVYADELTRDAVFDAMKNRRCYAATNSRILVEFEVNGVPMGQELTLWEPTRFKHISGLVGGTGEIAQIEVFKNNQPVYAVEGAGLVQEVSFTDESPTDTVDYYLLRVTQKDGEMAWSSPVWVRGGDKYPTWNE